MNNDGREVVDLNEVTNVNKPIAEQQQEVAKKDSSKNEDSSK